MGAWIRRIPGNMAVRRVLTKLVICPPDGGVCIVPYQDIAELSGEFPGLQSQILALVSRDFSRQQMCAEGFDARQQVAIFLFDVERRIRRHFFSGYEFDLPMSHEDIANYLRFSPETVSRVISKLQDEGVIQAIRKHIRLLDVARLGQIAQGVRSKGYVDSD